jgi:hypothetical protein
MTTSPLAPGPFRARAEWIFRTAKWTFVLGVLISLGGLAFLGPDLGKDDWFKVAAVVGRLIITLSAIAGGLAILALKGRSTEETYQLGYDLGYEKGFRAGRAVSADDEDLTEDDLSILRGE